jgi:hypothetical protein
MTLLGASGMTFDVGGNSGAQTTTSVRMTGQSHRWKTNGWAPYFGIAKLEGTKVATAGIAISFFAQSGRSFKVWQPFFKIIPATDGFELRDITRYMAQIGTIPPHVSATATGWLTALPHQTIKAAGFANNIIASSTNYTISASTDSNIFLSASGFTATLPAATGLGGRMYTVKLVSTSTGATIQASSAGQTIDGSTSYALTAAYQAVTLQSNSSNAWYVLSKST